jgi:hypothetical protein
MLSALAPALFWGVSVALWLLGLHRIWLIVLATTGRRDRPAPGGAIPDSSCPPLLLQLPLWNERDVVLGLFHAVDALRWPAPLLRVQVLDDSQDGTEDLVRAWIDARPPGGPSWEHRRRADREGWKAGALDEGLRAATEPYIVLLDADFRPDPLLLHTLVAPLLQDPGIAFVQARWGHQNRDAGALARGAAALLDGHFTWEHGGRARGGRFWNFNGTAGAWRREAIAGSGGWSGRTLVEDLDLSYRAQLRGWQGRYLEHVVVPGLVPVDARGFRAQQRRWAKGALQTLRILGPEIRDSPIRWAVRHDAILHLASPLSAPLAFVFGLLHPLAIAGDWAHRWPLPGLLQAVLFPLGLSGILCFQISALHVAGRRPRWAIPVDAALALALGAGLCLNGTRAAWEVLRGETGTFERTPKGPDARRAASVEPDRQAPWEIGLGLWQIVGLVYAVRGGAWASVPFLVLYAWGLLRLGLGAAWPRARAKAHAIPSGAVASNHGTHGGGSQGAPSFGGIS